MGVVVVHDGVTCSFVLVCGVDAAAVVVDDAVNGANVVLGVLVVVVAFRLPLEKSQ